MVKETYAGLGGLFISRFLRGRTWLNKPHVARIHINHRQELPHYSGKTNRFRAVMRLQQPLQIISCIRRILIFS